MSDADFPRLIRPRVLLGPEKYFGPGKIELLRAVAEHGSISAAARAQGMGYKRAWSLLDELNKSCRSPVIESSVGGSGGGGATITPMGKTLIAHYDAIEAACNQAAAPHFASLRRAMRGR